MKMSEFEHLDENFLFSLGMKTKTRLKHSHVGKITLNQWVIVLIKELTNGKMNSQITH